MIPCRAGRRQSSNLCLIFRLYVSGVRSRILKTDALGVPTASVTGGDPPVTTMKHLLQENFASVTVLFSAMARSTGISFVSRRAAAALAVLLLSAVALAAPRPVERASCCRSVEAPMSCCSDGDSPADSSATCCRLSATEETTPSLQSPAAPVLAAPAATVLDLPLPALDASFAGYAGRVAPRARSAPLHLLYSVLLV
jgi:hypothetical protein